MAKALLGHLGPVGPQGQGDPRVVAEVRRLRQRVSDLESQLLALKAENDALRAAPTGPEVFAIPRSVAKEPALA